MLNMTIYYPKGSFTSVIDDPATSLKLFCQGVADGMDRAMSCNNYDGEWESITFDNIAFQLVPYTEGEDRFAKRPVHVVMSGYDYPDRMENIGLRVKRAHHAIERLVTCEPQWQRLEEKVVSFVFQPIAADCRV